MNQPVPSLQAQRISVLPHPQTSVNAKESIRLRALLRNKEDPYPELNFITPVINEAVDDHVKHAIEEIIEMISVVSVDQEIDQKTAMALIAHSIERIHYNNQQQGIQ